MRSFRVTFSEDEEETLKKNSIRFNKNERNYLYYGSKRKIIKDFGVPMELDSEDFKWFGSSWKKLFEDFCNHFITIIPDFKVLLTMNPDFSNKKIFLREKITNSIGPLSNGLFIDGNRSPTHIWWSIIYLSELITSDYANSLILYVHYPSAIEPKEIIDIIWKKEIITLHNYLNAYGYNREKIDSVINSVRNLNKIYREKTKNYVFYLIDRKQDLSNAISYIKKTNLYQQNARDFDICFEHITTIKSELLYPDFTYR